MSDDHGVQTPTVRDALARAREAREKVAWLWELTPKQRLTAFENGDMTLGDCLAWARRLPDEPPLAADGEYLFIACRTPEWADDEPAAPKARSAGRER